jgi:hypothetical protein
MADADGGDGGSKTAVWAALIGNVPVAVTKAGAAVFTGSSAMLSETVHSFVDTGNELLLLLYGMRVARKKADRDHPAGYGRELYFWSFSAADRGDGRRRRAAHPGRASGGGVAVRQAAEPRPVFAHGAREVRRERGRRDARAADTRHRVLSAEESLTRA